MRPELYNRLRAASRELADVLAPLPTVRVALACREIFECDAPTAGERFGLHSPYRQANYILAMLATSPEPDTANDDDSESAQREFGRRWQRALKLVAEVFDLYARMYWPEEAEEWTGRDRATRERDGLAMRAFLHQHTSGLLADLPQVIARVKNVLSPFDDELEAHVGLSATTAATICEWLHEGMQRQLDRDVEILARLKEIYYEGVKTRTPADALIARAASDPRLHELRTNEFLGSAPFTVGRAAVERAFGEKATASFWSMFTTGRGSVSLPLGVDEPNPVENAPLLLLSQDEAILPVINPLPRAIWARLSGALDTPELRARFASRRGRVHEDNVARVIQEFVGAGAEVWRAAYEQPDAQFEHDLVVLAGRTLFVIEAKAAPLDPVFRDPERAVVRLRRQFRAEEGIQSGVDQAERIRRRLVDQKEIMSLYERHGSLLREIRPSDVDEVLCVCVTADDYGVLATELSLLERGEGQPYPWVVNAHDLETFLKALRKRQWSLDRLVQFLLERRRLHGRVSTTDELEVAGVFIRHGTLQGLIEADADMVQLGSDMSSVFDEIFLEEHGGPPAMLDSPGPIVWTDLRAALSGGAAARARGPAIRRAALSPGATTPAPRVGRNDRCPCGSGLKYKRCHGR
jgi:hypothetical protein